jgi:RNA polymerase sigma-70 factor, ECF subfamily
VNGRPPLPSRTGDERLAIDCEQKENKMEVALIEASNRTTSSTDTANSLECGDETLVAAAKCGSRPAFEQLIERYQNKLLHVARSLAQSREDAEEITQDAFLQAFKNVSRFRGESRFYTWLVRITINAGLMRLRRHHSRVISIDDKVDSEGGIPPSELEDGRATPERSYLQQELQEILATTIGKLPSGYRSVFELRAVQGLSTEETAQALDLSKTAVKSRLRRARLQMRQALTERLRAAHRRHRYFGPAHAPAPPLPGYGDTGLLGGIDKYN